VPTFYGSFTLNFCCGNASAPDIGFGSLSAIDLGNGSTLATQGSITLNAIDDGGYMGTYALYRGGPTPAWTTDGSQFDYGNLVYPGASSHLDCNGLLFGNHGLYETTCAGTPTSLRAVLTAPTTSTRTATAWALLRTTGARALRST
jgi:hypothetical protein